MRFMWALYGRYMGVEPTDAWREAGAEPAAGTGAVVGETRRDAERRGETRRDETILPTTTQPRQRAGAGRAGVRGIAPRRRRPRDTARHPQPAAA